MNELRAVFENVHRSLRPGGRFVFDLILEAEFTDRYNGESTEAGPDFVCISRASFDAASKLAETQLTLFVPRNAGWARHDVILTQRCFSEQEVLDTLAAAGFDDAEIEVHDSSSKLSGRGVFHATRSAAP